MKDENVLFIGGPSDGERRSVVSGISYVQVAVMPELTRHINDPAPGHGATFREVRYSRQRLRGEHADSVVYVADGVDAISALINGYRRK